MVARDAKQAVLAKGVRLTGTARDQLQNELTERYSSGESIRSLARATGRSYGFVHNLLVAAEVPLRGRGGANRRKA